MRPTPADTPTATATDTPTPTPTPTAVPVTRGDCNLDAGVNAGDLSGAVLLIFNGPGACGP